MVNEASQNGSETPIESPSSFFIYLQAYIHLCPTILSDQGPQVFKMVKNVQVDKAPSCVLVLVNEGGPEAGVLGTSLWAMCYSGNTPAAPIAVSNVRRL